MATIPAERRTFLTQSFRFGPAVAEAANTLLGHLDAALRLVGSPFIESSVDTVDKPNVVLCRTNACAVETALLAQQGGRKVHLVGGAADVLGFARAAQQLMDKGFTYHPELVCFNSWQQVQDYVRLDAQGHELAMLVRLVENYGTEVIIQVLEQSVPEAQADVVVSTAHKAKGREWDRVLIANDFPAPDDGSLPDPSELRLAYVAATRAALVLDPAGIEHLLKHTEEMEVAV